MSFNDTSDQILSGGIDNEIKVSIEECFTFSRVLRFVMNK